jgi:hypothetical protein
MDGTTHAIDNGGAGSGEVDQHVRADATGPDARHSRRRRFVLAALAVAVLVVGTGVFLHEQRGPRYPTARALLGAALDQATGNNPSQLVTYQDFTDVVSTISNTPGNVPVVDNSGLDQIDYPDGPVWMVILGTDTACVAAPTRTGIIPPFVACPPYHLPSQPTGR